jgi:hypothetical protein
MQAQQLGLPRASSGERGVAPARAVAALPRAARHACVSPPGYGPAAVPRPPAWPRGRSAAPDAGRPGCASGGRRWPDRACGRGRARSPRCGAAAGGRSEHSPGRWCSRHGSVRPPSPSSGGGALGDRFPVAGRVGALRRVSARGGGPALRGPRVRPGTRESPCPHALGTGALEAVGSRACGARRGLALVERPSRWASNGEGTPVADPALSSASSQGDQGLEGRRGAIPSAWRRATTASGERASRPAICSTGSWSAYSRRSSWSSDVLQRVATAHLKRPLGPRERFDVPGADLTRFACGRSQRSAR